MADTSNEQAIILAALMHGGRRLAASILAAPFRPHDFDRPEDRDIALEVVRLARGGEYTYGDLTSIPAMAPLTSRMAEVSQMPWSERVCLEMAIPAVREANSIRLIRESIEGVYYGIRNEGWDSAKAVSEIQSIIERQARNGRSAKTKKHIGEVMKEALEGLLSTESQRGICIGVSGIDYALNGLRDGELTYIGARPGVGKTQLLSQWTVAAALEGKKAVFISAEMSSKRIAQRMTMLMAGVSIHTIRLQGGPTPQQQQRILEAGKKLIAMPIEIIEAVGLPVTDICAMVRSMAIRKEVDMIAVDYLQILAAPPGVDDQGMESAVSFRSARLRELAVQTQRPVLCAAQLSRDEYANKRPTLQSFRGSGAAEQDCDNALFLHLPSAPDPPPGEPLQMEIIVGKQRDGEAGRVETVLVERATGRFYSRSDRQPGM